MSWRRLPPPSPWRRWLPPSLHLPAQVVFYSAIAIAVAVIGIALLSYFEAKQFDITQVARLPGGMVVYDREGHELPVSSAAGRRLVNRKDIPDFLVHALQAREDARFFEHGGVDLRGLARATLRNLRDRDFTQGASTVTMQLARNTFNMRAKSIHRKFLEIALTYRVEANYTKDEILTHYLNRVYFGSGAYGIEQAAQTYFGKSTRDLNPSECALIVGIIRGPHIFSPLRNLNAAIEQRNQTLKRMQSMGFLDEKNLNTLIATRVKVIDEDDRESLPSYALQAVNRELAKILAELDIRLDGLKVYTTLDSGWQERLDAELARTARGLEQQDGWTHPTPAQYVPGAPTPYVQYAAMTTEVRTGAILALIGGRDFSHSRFDRTRSTRDIGPVFLPFVAAAAAENGKPIVPDQPVQTGRQIGPAEVERLARKCGFSGPFADTEDLFRGTAAATPQEMSIALSTLGHQGKRPTPYLIREIRNAFGDVIYTAHPQTNRALSSKAAGAALALLPSAAGARSLTGATASERDAWALRLGPSGATAIWLGFDKPSAIAADSRLQVCLSDLVRRLGND